MIQHLRDLFRKITFPKNILAAILAAGLLHGLLYFILVPPWWHYDEPGHFEYAWLAAHLPHWPQAGQYDQGMRQQLGESLQRYGWYQIHNLKPDLSGSSPIPIGTLQVGDEPGYYFLASLPLRLIPNADITLQYDVVRLLSLLMYLAILAVVWFAMGELVSGSHPLRWMVPAFLALLPAFVDTMVSVNNDVSAVLAVSLFFWAALRLMKRGFSIRDFLFLAVTLILCYLSKSTAYFTFLLAPLVLLFSLLRGKFAWLIWGITAAGLLAAVLFAFDRGLPLAWYQNLSQAAPVRAEDRAAPVGNYVFQFDYLPTNRTAKTLQLIPPASIESVRGQTLTLGAWIWADRPMQAKSPFVRLERVNGVYVNSPSSVLDLNTSPAFFSQTFTVPNDAINAILYVQYAYQTTNTGRIFVDGLTLATGEHGNTPPHFKDPDGEQGQWDSQGFTNLIRNGSAEQASLRLRPRLAAMTSSVLNTFFINLPLTLTTLQDWQGNGWYYRFTASLLVRTFWASLAGNKVNLPGSFIIDLMAILSLLGLAGTVRLIWLRRKEIRWDMVYILAASVVIAWMLAAVRGVSTLLSPSQISGWARYAFPAILPTALALCAGWWAWLEWLAGRFKLAGESCQAVFLGSWIGLSAFALMDTVQYFHPGGWNDWGSLVLLLILQYLAAKILLERKAHPSP